MQTLIEAFEVRARAADQAANRAKNEWTRMSELAIARTWREAIDAMRGKGIPRPVVIDTTDATTQRWPTDQVIRDAKGEVIALCPLREELLPNGQFSWAGEIQEAINNG
jgi:hypothetical protein